MARKRMIDPSIWINEDFGTLTNLAKLVYIGLISMADDEGRGKASPAYIKAVLFPYNDDLRIADIIKTLSEISSTMSVIFYSCDENTYYTLTSWKTWQKIDKPSKSKIPNFNESTMERLSFDEYSTNTLRTLSLNRIEKNKNIKENKEKRNTKEKRTNESNKKFGEFEDIIKSNFTDDEVIECVNEFIKMRNTIKKPLTKRGLELMIKKLYKLTTNIDEQIEILNNSIMNNWQSVYPLKKNNEVKNNKGNFDDFKELWEEARKEDEQNGNNTDNNTFSW